jgi:hypothetical protein
MRLPGFAIISLATLATALLLPAGDGLWAFQVKKDKATWQWKIIDAGEYKKGAVAGPGVKDNVLFGNIPTGATLSVIVEFHEDPGDVFMQLGKGKAALKNPVINRFVLTSANGKSLGNCTAYLRPKADGPGYRNLVFEWPQINDKKLYALKDIVLIDTNGYFAPIKVGAVAKAGPEKKDDVAVKEKDKDPAKKVDQTPVTAEEKERMAAEKLESAKQVLKDGNVALARIRLQGIIDDYPLSMAAGEARELLKSLSKK